MTLTQNLTDLRSYLFSKKRVSNCPTRPAVALFCFFFFFSFFLLFCSLTAANALSMQEFRWQRKKSLRYICTMCLYCGSALLHCQRANESCLSVHPSVHSAWQCLAASQPGLQLVASPPSCLTTHLGQIPQNEHQSKANCACNMTKAPDVRWAMCDVV